MLMYIGCGNRGKKSGAEFGHFVFHFGVMVVHVVFHCPYVRKN